MSWEAVHENRVRRRLREERFVYLMAGKCRFTRGQFIFLSHAGPYICVNRLRARNSFLGRIANFDLAAGFARPGGVVLLSPAYKSFDMFKDFEDRGRQFKAAVNARFGAPDPQRSAK